MKMKTTEPAKARTLKRPQSASQQQQRSNTMNIFETARKNATHPRPSTAPSRRNHQQNQFSQEKRSSQTQHYVTSVASPPLPVATSILPPSPIIKTFLKTWESKQQVDLSRTIAKNELHFTVQNSQKKIRTMSADVSLQIKSIDKKHPKSRIEMYESIIRANPGENDVVVFNVELRKITAMLEANDFMEAKKWSDRVGREFNNADKNFLIEESSKFWCLRSGALVGLNRFEGAIFAASKAITIDKNNIQAQFYLASSLYNLQRHYEAINPLSTIIAAQPKHLQSHFLRIECKRCCCLWGEILEDGKVMLKLFKTKQDLPPRKDQDNEIDRSIAVDTTRTTTRQHAQSRHKTISTIYTSLAEALLHLGLLKKSEKASTLAIQFDRSNKMAFQIRGECRYNLNQFKGSVADFQDYSRLKNSRKLGAALMPSPSFTLWRTHGRQNRDMRKWGGIHEQPFKLV